MPTLTPEGRSFVRDLARRHGFGEEAVTRMLAAVTAGNGRMAQFAHPEFGGSGQWMAGGMLMLGDMFDHALKGRVEALCTDISEAFATGASSSSAPTRSQRQGQGQGSGGERDEGWDADLADSPFFEGTAPGAWWPAELGTPSASGTQNAVRYAYFADACRLVLDDAGTIRVYDTLDHRIGGFSQQQGGRDGMSMSSQHGTVELGSLPLVSPQGDPPAAASEASDASAEPARAEDGDGVPCTGVDTEADGGGHGDAPAVAGGERADRSSAAPRQDDPLRLIERLGDLREAGLLTDEEFAAKKQELLSRL